MVGVLIRRALLFEVHIGALILNFQTSNFHELHGGTWERRQFVCIYIYTYLCVKKCQ